jgi:thiol-disulfide isomerase/thioredoxin
VETVAKTPTQVPAPAAEPPAPAVAKPVAATPVEKPAEIAVGFEVGQKIPAYKSTVQRPDGAASKSETFDAHAVTKPTAYIVTSTTCPYCAVYTDRLKELERTYIAKGVDIVYVYSVREQTEADKTAHYKSNGFTGGLIVETDAAFAKNLDVTKTPTAILTDAKGTIVYRGRIDDNAKPEKVTAHELADAIDATLAGKPVAVTKTEPFG